MRSGPGEARTILLLHFISVRPSKHMVRTFLEVYIHRARLLFFVSARTNKTSSSSRPARVKHACEEDAGGREAGAPSDLKMPLENGRADERVSRGQARSEQYVCVRRYL